MNRRGINANTNINSQTVMDDASWKNVNVPENASMMGGGGNNNPSLNPDASNQGGFA